MVFSPSSEDYLRSFGIVWFIVDFLKGTRLEGSKPIEFDAVSKVYLIPHPRASESAAAT